MLGQAQTICKSQVAMIFGLEHMGSVSCSSNSESLLYSWIAMIESGTGSLLAVLYYSPCQSTNNVLFFPDSDPIDS